MYTHGDLGIFFLLKNLVDGDQGQILMKFHSCCAILHNATFCHLGNNQRDKGTLRHNVQMYTQEILIRNQSPSTDFNLSKVFQHSLH